MNRTQPDEWSLGTTPSSITSFFTLALKDGRSRDTKENTTYTGNSGLGWRFLAKHEHADTELLDAGILIVWQMTRYHLFFEPHLINNINLKQLTITVEVQNLTGPEKNDYSVVLPTAAQIPLGSYLSPDNFTGDAIIEFQVKFSGSFSLSLPTEPVLPKLQRMLEESLTGHDLLDTKFYLFARRTREYRVTDPQAIFASSSLLRGYSSYLDTLLGENSESAKIDLDSDFSINLSDKEYDYLSDSDLESELGDEPTLEGGADKDYSMNELRMLEDESGPSQLHSQENQKATTEPPASEYHKHFGQIIIINDTAFKTWKSLVFYMYTRELEFKPLRSSHRSSHKMPLNTLACSPKSMYRLADKIGLLDLQNLSLDAIRRSLNSDNILDEIFSKFTSMYPKVQEVEVEFLMAHLTSNLFQQFLEKLRSVVGGAVPHCSDALSNIISRIYNGNEVALYSSTPRTSQTLAIDGDSVTLYSSTPRTSQSLAIDGDNVTLQLYPHTPRESLAGGLGKKKKKSLRN